MRQSRLESALEITANYMSGFLVAYLLYRFIVMPSDWLVYEPFLVTGLFTVTSVIRSYLWRRFFNAELHRLIHNFIKRILIWQKINMD